MKKLLFTAFGIVALLLAFAACSGSKNTVDKSEYECIAYVWLADGPLPPADAVTAINYSFCYPDSNLTGIAISNEPRFLEVIALKKENPDLKVLICLGGNCYAGYPKIAASDSLRKAFAADCRRVIDQYGIDGIDFDWEFPGAEGGTPDDIDNFVLLLKEIRNSIGKDKILSVAGGAAAGGLKLPEIMEYVDYINVMSYDMGWQAPYHHTALHRSPLAGVFTVEESLDSFLTQGVPYDKLVLGLAFYGRGDDKYFKGWTDYRDIKLSEGMEQRWDSVACVPYIVDSLGNLILGFENPRSLEIKCQYIKDKGMKGGMYWRTECDNDSLELTHTVARHLLGR